MADGRGEGACLAASIGVGSRSFRTLEAYRHAVALADAIQREALSWSSFDRWTVGVQLVRAADSIGANIAEATGRWQAADRKRLLFIARGSLHETEHWLLRAQARGLLKTGFQTQVDEVARTLNGLINRTRDAVSGSA